jgi:cyclophilin family peptidyl-prolyl cis-trans isomerase
MKRALSSILVLTLAASLPLAAATKEVLSKVYPIEKKYKSMEGPSGVQTIYLGDRERPELVWLTGIKTEVVGEEGKGAGNPDLMCHMNVDIDPVKHRALFNLNRYPASRLMTLSQGMLGADGTFAARLPEGFGFPMSTGEPLYVMTQVLNHNIEHPENLRVRHRVTFEFIPAKDVKQPMKAVFNIGASGMVQMADNRAIQPLSAMAATSVPDAQTEAEREHGATCLIGMRAPNAAGMSSDYTDPQGRHLTGHWVVPPGRQTNHTDITWFMRLPYDVKLHYAAVHVHPFAESLTLRDATTDQEIFKAGVKNPKQGVGLEHVDEFVSVEGVKLYKDHKYEMISVYNNPTQENADSMASMFFALSDPEFAAPTSAQLRTRGVTLDGATALVLRTTAGDVGISFMKEQAPQTVLRMARLFAAGAFRGAKASVTPAEIRFTTPMTQSLRAILENAPRENGILHKSGVVSVCLPDAAAKEVSFSVILTAMPDRDGRCIAFAQVGPGGEVLRTISGSAAPAKLVRGELLSQEDVPSLKLAPAHVPVASLR